MDQIKENPISSLTPKNSRELKSELRDKFNTISQRVFTRMRASKNFQEVNKFQKEIDNFIALLRKKYPNAEKYVKMHYILGSSVDLDQQTVYEDFPGDDSVEKFVASLEEKYK